MDGAATLSLAGLGIAALAVLLVKLGAIADTDARALIAIAIATPILGALAGAAKRVSRLVAARMLDRSHATSGRIAAALELASSGETGPWIERAIEDAAARASELRPSRAMPLRLPRDAAPALGLALAVGFLGSLEIPRRIEIPIARGITPLLLHADDLDAYDQRVRDVLAAGDVAPEVREEAQALNQVLEDLVDRRIDREETLRRLAEIEARIAARPPADASLLRDELRAMGTELRRAPVAQDLADAIRDADPVTAEAEMRELAARLRSDPPSRQELARLREALEDAARERPAEDAESEQRHEEESERLLQRRREQGASAEEQQHLLEQRRRELDQLRREHQQQAEARRRLDRLRREMDEAAQDLQRESGESEQREQASQDLEQAAEDLNRMAQQQMSEEQMQQLARQLEELRELVRRQREQQQAGGQGGEGSEGGGQSGQGGQGGQGESRMDRFVLRAGGGGEGQGMPIGTPGGGEGEGEGQGSGQGGGQGSDGAQPGGAGEGTAEGSSGGGGGEEQQMLMLGQGGTAELQIPGMGGQSGGDQQGAGGSGEPQSPGGGAGDEHAPASLEDPTRLGGAGRTVQVRGDAQGGPSRSEVIHSASQRGFATRGYRDVYSEYADHAEEVIERDEVPPGYRFYVRRYFQLIRPRDGE